MSTEITAANEDASDFAASAGKNFVPTTAAGGFLVFTKSGEWLYGQDEEPVDGMQVVIMSKMIEQGWMRWGTKPPAKVFRRVSQPYPEAPESVEGLDNDGRATTFNAVQARQFGGVFKDEDLGSFIFNTNSKGGVEAVDKLYAAIIAKAHESAFFYPVVTLESDSYKHASYGKIYKPTFTVVKWCDVDGLEVGAEPKKVTKKAEPEAEVETDAPPRRRKVRQA